MIIQNHCRSSIWPAYLSGDGHVNPRGDGFHLASGEDIEVRVPCNWFGRVWARTNCTLDSSQGLKCKTGCCDGKCRC
ncbi:hypothetical protein DF186_18840, partial [Enterococcus hirae]